MIPISALGAIRGPGDAGRDEPRGRGADQQGELQGVLAPSRRCRWLLSAADDDAGLLLGHARGRAGLACPVRRSLVGGSDGEGAGDLPRHRPIPQGHGDPGGVGSHPSASHLGKKRAVQRFRPRSWRSPGPSPSSSPSHHHETARRPTPQRRRAPPRRSSRSNAWRIARRTSSSVTTIPGPQSRDMMEKVISPRAGVRIASQKPASGPSFPHKMPPYMRPIDRAGVVRSPAGSTGCTPHVPCARPFQRQRDPAVKPAPVQQTNHCASVTPASAACSRSRRPQVLCPAMNQRLVEGPDERQPLVVRFRGAARSDLVFATLADRHGL